MGEIMYELNWHSYSHARGEVFDHCTVTPITVIRRDIQPGASRETITAEDSDGRRFTGDPKDYYETSEEAWKSAKLAISESLAQYEEQLLKLRADISSMRAFLVVVDTLMEE